LLRRVVPVVVSTSVMLPPVTGLPPDITPAVNVCKLEYVTVAASTESVVVVVAKILVGSLAVLFEAFASGAQPAPPLQATVAVFVTLDGALFATLTVSVSGGRL